MLVGQVFHWYFLSVDLHPNAIALGEQVDVAGKAETKMLCEFAGLTGRSSLLFCAHSHVGYLNVDVFPFDVIALYQHDEFQLVCAVLDQNLVARQRHLGLVFPVVEGGQGVLDVATLSCE